MDRLVNIRIHADLSQAIQQFNLLGQAASGAQSAMGQMGGGLGGGGGGMGGIGPMLVPGGGGGRGGAGPGSAPSNPRTSNRGGGASSGIMSSGGITSNMFGLSQIGFALEDYQYAGWRGVMNNVPWIAQAAGSMIGGTPMGQAALLATSIGVPLGNAMWENMNAGSRNSLVTALGGLGMSGQELKSAEADRIEGMIKNMSSLDYRSVAMGRQVGQMRMQDGYADIANEYMNTPYRTPMSTQAKAGATAGFERFSQMGGGAAMSGAWNEEFNKNLARRSREAESDWFDNSSTLGMSANLVGQAAWSGGKALLNGKGFGEQLNEDMSGYFSAQANKDLKEQYNKVQTLVGDAIKNGDKSKLKEAIKHPLTPPGIRKQLMEMLKNVEEAERNLSEDNNARAVAEEDDQLTRDAAEGEEMRKQDDIKQYRMNQRGVGVLSAQMDREGSRGAMRNQSELSAVVAGVDRTGTTQEYQDRVSEAVSARLQKKGVSEDAANRIGDQVGAGATEARDDRKDSDEQLWERNSAQWIQAVKSDILQAQRASYGRGGFNQKTFNSYMSRIKTKIRDDLGSVGVSKLKREDYAKMIWDAAYEEAQQAFGDAKNIATNQIKALGMDPSKYGAAVNAGTMENLVGQMGDDLNAVYGNAQTNTFFMQRQMNANYRRQQIRMNRFAR